MEMLRIFYRKTGKGNHAQMLELNIIREEEWMSQEDAG